VLRDNYLGVERMQFHHLRVTDELGVALEPGAGGVDVRVGVGQHVEPAWSFGHSKRTEESRSITVKNELKQHVCRRIGSCSMSADVLTWLLEAGEVGDAGCDLAHDGLDLPHDLLVALLLDRPAARQHTFIT
jgi:hypothetical protein